MIKLREAKLTDAVPGIVAAQPWVQAMAGALAGMTGLVLDFADGSQVYTSLDTAPEEILDALAICWNINWYDTGYPVETKRRLVKTALIVRKTVGTKYAVREQTSAIYPDSMVEEWFEYGGTPGKYRIAVNATQEAVTVYTEEEIEKKLEAVKRCSAHLESLSYMVKHGLKVGVSVTSWIANQPYCGEKRCGTYWTQATLGHSSRPRLSVAGAADAFAANAPFTGTIPTTSTLGYTDAEQLAAAGAVNAYTADPAESGTRKAGTEPTTSVTGQSLAKSVEAKAGVEAFIAAPAESGVRRCGQEL